jgi:protein lifeguard
LTDQGYQGGYPQQPTVGFANPGYGQPGYGQPGGFAPGYPPQQPSFAPGYPPQPNPYQPPQQPQQGYDPSGKPLNPPYMDDSDPNYKAGGFGFDDKSIRRGFIRRVYSILSVS